MTWAPIIKRAGAERVAPNLDDYAGTRSTFTWKAPRAELDGLQGGRGLNITHEAVDRHAAGARRDHVAIRWLGKRGEVRDYTYARLRELTDRFANALDGLGVRRGERVFALAGRIPELYVAALGTLKHGSVFCPLFSAFGPEPIRTRMSIGRARVLVTTEAFYRRKVAALRSELPDLSADPAWSMGTAAACFWRRLSASCRRRSGCDARGAARHGPACIRRHRARG